MDQNQTYGSTAKGTFLWIEPEKLTIVGIDCPDEDMPDLADPDRIKLPITDLMLSIALHGVREVVKVRKFPGDSRVFVVTGRRRVRAAREVNKQLHDDSKIRIRCIPEPYDPLSSLAIENECRSDDPPYVKAEKAERMRARGDSDETIAATFAISRSGLRVWWAVRAASSDVKAAVKRGLISMNIAAEIGKFPPAEQSAALAKAIEDGGGAVAKENVIAARRHLKRGDGNSKGEDAPRRLSAANVKKFTALLVVNEEEEQRDVDVAETVRIAGAVLRAVQGDAKALNPYPVLKQKLKEVLAQ